MEKEAVEKEKKTTQQKAIFGIKIAGNVVFYAIIFLLFLFSIMNINGGNGTENFPNLFGSGWLSVQTDSMKRSSTKDDRPEWKDYEIGGFEAGDLLTDRVFSDSTTENLKVGDVITFVFNKGGAKALNTHRIVYISPDGKGVVTQGDARAQIQPYDTSDTDEARAYNYQLEASGAIETVLVEDIRGVVTKVSPGVGYTFDFIRANWFWFFILPVIIVLLVEIFLVVKNVLDLRNEKKKAELAGDKEAMMAELEAEKEKMRQELLAELKAQQAAEAGEETKDDVANETTIEEDFENDESSEDEVTKNTEEN